MTASKLLLILFLNFLCLVSQAGGVDSLSYHSAIAKYNELFKTGHPKEAITCLTDLLNSGIRLSHKERSVIYINLGILHKSLNLFDVALEYYDQAEALFQNSDITENTNLATIYGNKGNIYSLKGDFNKALEYSEKAIRFVEVCNGSEQFKQKSTSALNLNTGIIYYQLNNFTKALGSFQKSLQLKDKYKLSGKENLYKHLANTYAKIGDYPMAYKYYVLSIGIPGEERRNFSPDLVTNFLEYGHFLLTRNENVKALIIIQKALTISTDNVGEKNQLTSNCYQLMGDYYLFFKEYRKALVYYQKTLVSGSKDFNDQRIEANPLADQITLNLWQLRVLQRKADAMSMLAETGQDKNSKIRELTVSLNTINLAIEITTRIRVDYQDEETRLIFNEKQKNVFIGAIETALKLYDLTGEKRFLFMAYQTSQQSKANELKYEIARNMSFSSKEIPDSFRYKEREIQKDIALCNALIRNESASAKPDTVKLAYWKDQEFNLNRLLEKTIRIIDLNYPKITDKLKRGNIIPLETIQSNLKPDNSLIEYVFSETDLRGDRKLYEFVITPGDLVCKTVKIDSAMSVELSALIRNFAGQFSDISTVSKYNHVSQQLFQAYSLLIQPVEEYFTGKKLIIIPDNELAYLPFEAFLTSWTRRDKINYAELPFLIRDYSISYGYSTNTLWNNPGNEIIRPRVIGFAPEYSNTVSANGRAYRSLKNNHKEVDGILSSFSGSILRNEQATVDNFKANLNRGAILHLAMHAELDTSRTGSSGLVFTNNHKNQGNSLLYNYEIGQMSINSPMVVLSACNTGSGKYYSGEGLMSLARNFVLAGVPAVIETLWPVEDVAGSKIMGGFYKYLATGEPKNTALRLAKLDYINTTSPSFVNPGYWAAYTLMGDVSPFKKIWWKEYGPVIPIIFFSILILAVVILAYRLRFFKSN